MRTDDPDLSDNGMVELFIGAFAARTDLHVVNGAEVSRTVLGPDAVRKAVKHHYALSGYTAEANGRTHVGAIDFDTEDGFEQALKVYEVLDLNSITALICKSRRGAHVWVTSWDWTKPGLMARALTAAVGQALGEKAMEDTKIEVFPKPGDDLAAGALRLPGLAHHRTATVFPIIFNGKQEVAEPTLRQIIEGHVLTTPEAVAALAASGPRRTRYPKSVGGFYGFRENRPSGPAPKASEVLRDRWGVEVNPGGTARCPLHDDKRRSMTVFRDDERVYCGAPHCPLNGQGHGIGSVQLSKLAS